MDPVDKGRLTSLRDVLQEGLNLREDQLIPTLAGWLGLTLAGAERLLTELEGTMGVEMATALWTGVAVGAQYRLQLDKEQNLDKYRSH